MLKFSYEDGGRSNYFKTKNVKDCVVRAICNATKRDYKQVYDTINEMAKNERTGKRKRSVSNARNGVYKTTWKKYIYETMPAFEYIQTNFIGSDDKLHLDYDEIKEFLWQNGYDIKLCVCIISVSKHLTCLYKGVLLDTYDCSREEQRMIYGLWVKRIY